MNTVTFMNRFCQPLLKRVVIFVALFAACFATRLVGQTPQQVWVQDWTYQAMVDETSVQVWIPPSTTQVWVPPTTSQTWVPPTTAQTWIAAVTHQQWIPPVTHQQWVPPVTHQQWVPPVTHVVQHPAITHPVYHPAVTHMVHHDAVIGEQHFPEISHSEYRAATTHWETVDGYWDDDWVDGYDDWRWSEGYWDWQNVIPESGDAENNYWDWVWVEGGWGWVWVDGYLDSYWVGGYSYEVTDEEGGWVTVIDQYEHDEFYEISPESDEEVVDEAAYTEWVVDQEARTETVVDAEGYHATVVDVEGYHTTVVDVEGRFITVVDVEGRYVNVEVPGFWHILTTAGFWDTVTVPGRNETQVVPAHFEDRVTPGHWITVSLPTGTGTAPGPWDYESIATNVRGYYNADPARLLGMLPDWGWNKIFSGQEWGETDVFDFGALMYSWDATPTDARPYVKGAKSVEDLAGRIRLASGVALRVAGVAVLVAIALDEVLELWDFSYIVYVKQNRAAPEKFYAGRTFGAGAPAGVLLRRDFAHERNPDHYPAVATAVIVTRGLSAFGRYAMRGREQQTIDALGLNSTNTIRGVSRDNWLGYWFWKTSNFAYGNIAPYSGSEWTKTLAFTQYPDKFIVLQFPIYMHD